MIPLSPALIISAGHVFVGLGNSASGHTVSAVPDLVGRLLYEANACTSPETADPSAPWDAAFVHHVGYWAHYDQRGRVSSWPLPATANVEELAQYADTSGALYHAPVDGDLFLLWAPGRKKFVRTGIIARVLYRANFARGEEYHQCITIEAGNGDLAPNLAARVVLRERRLSPEVGDRVIRWTQLDAYREESAERVGEAIDAQARWAA